MSVNTKMSASVTRVNLRTKSVYRQVCGPFSRIPSPFSSFLTRLYLS
jgi:hypothetical protein